MTERGTDRSRLRFIGGVAGLLVFGCASRRSRGETVVGGAADVGRVEKSLEQWRAILPADRYHILFEEGTEPAGTSPLAGEKRAGTYLCAACNLPLFRSEKKYESGTGWPSFWEPLPGRLGTKTDWRLIFPRTEYHCVRCGGHQGHVFDDGPPPSGKRYCNNGLALLFAADGEPLPALRT